MVGIGRSAFGLLLASCADVLHEDMYMVNATSVLLPATRGSHNVPYGQHQRFAVMQR